MTKFAYAVGRIRALETHLLNENQIIRMVDAKDFESAFLVLRENPHYAKIIDELEHAFDFETLLEKELKSTQQLLEYLAPKNELLEIIWEKYDPKLPFSEYQKHLKDVAQKYQIPIFTKYAEGFVALNQLKINLLFKEVNIEEIENRYRYSDYYQVIKIGLEEYQKTGSLFALEREIDNFLLETIKRAKYQSFGIEPLIGFAIAKEIEIKILRLVLTSKRMQVKTEEIKKRLRLPYV